VYPNLSKSTASKKYRSVADASISGDHTGIAAQFNDPIEIADDTQAGERSVDHRPNATHPVFKSIEDISDEEWELTFKVNIHAMFYLTNGAVAHIKPASATPPRSPNLLPRARGP